jgi:rfaE bifunctional protein kinase chain/domain
MSWSLPTGDVREILNRLQDARVTVFGDFCLDAYWELWEGEPELSVETGLAVRRVMRQKTSLGGAGCVVANLREMGVKHVKAIGVAGADAFGETLRDMMTACGADTSAFLLHTSWETVVYAKPFLGSIEESRFDFGSFNVAAGELVDALLGSLEEAVCNSDVVILNQQKRPGITSPSTITRINEMIAKYPQTIYLVDSRHYQDHYMGASLKLNMIEAAELLQEGKERVHSEDRAKNFALRINNATGKPTFLTRGEFGIVVAVEKEVTVIPGLKVTEPIDTVGAGDAVVAALAAAMASGSNAVSAAVFANIAAMITVKKLKTTGTASAMEILEASENLQYVVAPNQISGMTSGLADQAREKGARAFYKE